MSPDEFKKHYNDLIISKLREKCQERDLIFKELDQMQVMMNRLDPNNSKLLTIENEVYLLYNDGNSTWWDFKGNIQ